MKIFKYIILGLTTTSLLSSCELNLYPPNAIETSQSFQSVNDAKNWSTRALVGIKSRVYGVYTFATDIQGDQLNAAADYGNTYGALQRWGDAFVSDNYEIRDVWRGYYNGILNSNTAIEGFKTINPKDDKEAKSLKEYTGIVHLARAYYYFKLNEVFAKAYNPNTANTDLSVPLVLVPDLNDKPARNTVQEVFNQILADLEIAKTNLVDVPGKANSSVFTIDVVTALEAKVKFAKQDWAGAKAAAESLITGGKYPLYNTAADVKAMWHNDKGGEVIFAPFASINELPSNVNDIYIGWDQGNKRYRPLYLPSKWVVDAFASNDFRKDAYFLNVETIYQNGKYYSGVLVNKYPGNPALRAETAATNYAQSQKLFRIAEMYLIAAESAFKSSPSNANSALTHLNTLRIARGLSALSGVSGNVLFEEIKAERFRELAFEGFRLNDLKRWNEPMVRKEPQDILMLQDGPDFVTKNVPANDNKFVWGIPSNDIIANPNLIQNSGW